MVLSLVQDFLSTYKYASKWINTFNNNPEMIKIHPVYYLKVITFFEALSLIKHPSKFKNCLNDMIEVVEDSDFL